MNFLKRFTTWLLLLTIFLVSGVVNAKVASGVQNLSGGLHQAETGFNSLIRQAKIGFSYDDASGSPVATKKTTVLGENMMQRVIPYAEKTGARTLPFGTTAEKWAKLTPKQRWKLNDGALRKRINEGDNFEYIGRDPGRSPATRKKFDLTGSELLRLKDRGVPYKAVNP